MQELNLSHFSPTAGQAMPAETWETPGTKADSESKKLASQLYKQVEMESGAVLRRKANHWDSLIHPLPAFSSTKVIIIILIIYGGTHHVTS